GTDVGGYQGEGYIPQDLYLRWLQAGSMAGLFEIKLDGAGGEGRDRMPWSYDEAFQKNFRAVLEERMRLIPYLYSLSRTSGSTGTLMQPLAYRHLADRNTYDIWDEFYLGDAILVAPMFGPGTTRQVNLPEGEWYDYEDPAQSHEGGKVIRVEAPLDKVSRFVKQNSLYVTGNLYRGNDRLWSTTEPELVVHAVPGRGDSMSTLVYADLLDHGTTKSMQLRRIGKRLHFTSPALSCRALIQVRLATAPKNVSFGGAPAQFDYDAAKMLLSVRVPAHRLTDLAIDL
ncbi:MAG TPA: TIM-barrel domain-containing protein, partial [Povalibacter sp.]|nr:TIM-barrel domain-containing protein [Povalibacter sp.]